MSTLARIVALSTIILVIALAVRVAFPSRSGVVQPIAYNHNLHVEQEGLECTDCHVHVETLAAATIPSLDICLDCHDEEPLSESPEEAKLIQHIEAGQEIPWERIYQVPDHVYFSHRRHVVSGELSCSSCHGNIAEQTAPSPFPLLPVTMDACMDCHETHKVTNDCLACHR